jgi:hypothetical protein
MLQVATNLLFFKSIIANGTRHEPRNCQGPLDFKSVLVRRPNATE